MVHRAFCLHPLAHTGLGQEVHRDLLQNASPDAAQHRVAALALDDDVVDAGLVQQLAEQQAGGASADDRNLGTHEFVSCIWVRGDCRQSRIGVQWASPFIAR